MKSIRSTLLAASLLAGLSGLTMAQTPAEPSVQGPRAERMDKMHTKMGARHAQHLADLKSKLNLQVAQEDAWGRFAQAMQKPERMARPERAQMEKMSTPERLDQMKSMTDQRHAQMLKRIESTRSFYATLSAEQQQVFDKASGRSMGRMGGGMHRMKHGGGHHGMR